jgi:hypothetical protein
MKKYFWQNMYIVIILLIALSINNNSHSATNKILLHYQSISDNKMLSQVVNTSQVNLDTDGRLIVNKQPFFAFGLCHDWFPISKEKRLKDIKDIADAGFNVIATSVSDNHENDLDVLDESQKLGIYYMGHYYHRKINNQNFLDIVDKYKQKPSLLGWNIADDVDYPSNNYDPIQIKKLSDSVKSLDGNHITYITAFSKNIRAFLNSADVIGFESYPISNDVNDKNPLLSNYENMITATKYDDGTPYSQTIFAYLQAFPWDNSRLPTSQEIYNMTYASLLNGVKGIIYYSYSIDEDKWYLPEHEDLWNGIKSLAPEVKKLSPVLLEGKLTKLDTQLDNLQAGQWVYKDSLYVVVINTSSTDTITASLTISDKVLSQAQPLFPGRPSGMTFQNGKLSGLIQPGDVHIYQLSKG